MNGQTLVERVREDKRTELERLGSEKALLAVTGADLSAGTILGHVAATVRGLAETMESWADGAEGPERSAFEEAAADLEAEYERVVAHYDAEPSGEPPVPLGVVRGFEGTTERVAAAFVGHGLVFDGTLLQSVSFFVNEADAERADLIRDLRDGANSRVDDGATTLDSLCRDDDWDRARTATEEVVEAAYRDYVETLGGMGIDPKPVC
jgi:hypothetical protein